jgi:hypothetical protein
MTRILALLALASIHATGGFAVASLIVAGDPTTNLSGDLFVDLASTGGGDINAATTLTFNRVFDLNGMIGAPLTAGEVTMKGFGFATPGNNPLAMPPVINNTAATVQLTFTYLGQDGAFGGGDDVVVGSTEGFVWNDGISGNGTGWEGANQYYVNFDTTPSALIDGLGETFRIELVATGGNVRFKTTGMGAQPLSAAKFSFSGTFAAVPEPSAMLVFGAIGTIASLTRRRRS